MDATEPARERELAWYRRWGAAAAAWAGRTTSVAPAAKTACGSYDASEAMELGLSRALLLSYTEPPGSAAPGLTCTRARSGQRRLLVTRSADRLSYALSTEEGDDLLHACVAGEDEAPRFDIYVLAPAAGDAPCVPEPAFSVEALASGEADGLLEWSLRAARCSHCEASGPDGPVLARARHYRERVGGGTALCLDVELPGRSAGGCERCPADAAAERLTSRRPVWNRRLRSLCMDFGGRCSVASIRNFQLETTSRGRITSRLFFGKVAGAIASRSSTFALEYQQPFGAVQAFGVALTAMHLRA